MSHHRGRTWLAGSALAALALPPHAAAAHSLTPGIGDFYAGGLHLVSAPDDGLQWLGLCAFAGTQKPEWAGWVAETVVVGLLGGFLASGLTGTEALVATAGAVGLLAVGLLLAAGRVVPGIILLGLGAATGFIRGLHYGLDGTGRADQTTFAAGIVLTGYVVMVVGVAFMVRFAPLVPAWRTVALRAFGSWIAAIGAMVGAYSLVHPL